MKTRIVAIALALTLASSSLLLLVLWPLLRPLWHWGSNGGTPPLASELLARVRVILPPLVLLDVIALAVITYIVLDLTIGRPLRRTEEVVEQLQNLRLELPLDSSGGGPLLSRIQGSLRRMADALKREQKVTSDQLAELREKNERLTRAQQDLIRSEQLALLGRVAAGIAHEVGNPLMGILGYISLLKDKPAVGEDVRSYLGLIESEVQRIDGIVRGLLDLGRPPRANPTELELRAVVQTCAELLRGGKETSAVAVRNDVESSARVLADRALLAQLLLNLFLNAAQAMNGRGQITVNLEARDGHALVHVDDEGPGLPPEVRARLFEPFFTTKPGKGTGLGLAVSLQLARALGGELRAENGQRGARFTIELPLANG